MFKNSLWKDKNWTTSTLTTYYNKVQCYLKEDNKIQTLNNVSALIHCPASS